MFRRTIMYKTILAILLSITALAIAKADDKADADAVRDKISTWCKDKKIPEFKENTLKSQNNLDLMAQGILYSGGICNDVDLYRALKVLNAASDKNFIPAMFLASQIYMTGPKEFNNPKKAFALIDKASNLGDVEAKFQLGNFYINGIGTEANLNKGIGIFESVKDKNPKAYTALAQIYATGTEDRPKDEKKAIQYLQNAAQKDEPVALFLLGLAYYSGGLELPKDIKKSRSYLGKAMTQGHPTAPLILGNIEEKGENTGKKNDVEATMWYIISANRGDKDGGAALQRMLSNLSDKQVEESYNKAKKLLNQYNEPLRIQLTPKDQKGSPKK